MIGIVKGLVDFGFMLAPAELQVIRRTSRVDHHRIGKRNNWLLVARFMWRVLSVLTTGHMHDVACPCALPPRLALPRPIEALKSRSPAQPYFHFPLAFDFADKQTVAHLDPLALAQRRVYLISRTHPYELAN